MPVNSFPPDDDDDEPEMDEVTSSTRLIDDADRHSPAVVRRRMTGVGTSSAYRQTASQRSTVPCRDPPSPVVKTETGNDEQFCCCCCCCNCDVNRPPPVCHCRCPATRRFYFRSAACPSDDDDEEEADNDDNESACSCCQCDADLQASTTPTQTGNELLPVAATKLSSVTAMSLLSGRGLNDVNGGVSLRSTAKDARSPTVVVSSSTTGSGLTGSGLASFFAFLRSGGRLWSSGRPASAVSDVEWRRRRGRASSTLPPCTCGLGSHFEAPLGVAQQVRHARHTSSLLSYVSTRVCYDCVCDSLATL